MNIEDTDPPEYHLTTLNMQIREMMNAVLRPHRLKLVEWRLLQCLSDQGALSVCDLASLAVIERTATSRLVDRLVEKGFVAKEQMPDDRRFSQVSLCEAGLEILKACTADVDAARSQLFGGLNQTEISSFLNTLKKLQHNAVGVLLERGRMPRPVHRSA
ncbi:MarR family winged helix-turn-helix transcriptional regulator [Ruegeria lacuscaerulensis]|uniref:MarR family winged helix-turn-helix transcriptional regulator n=1 Tax=Ruegeria lacuscaerulensis TaxID=55218 RepID=UPI00147F3462|nr:MarR family transcriptional regulator [Ruegeria lacuscaerulensis]